MNGLMTKIITILALVLTLVFLPLLMLWFFVMSFLKPIENEHNLFNNK